MCDRIREINIKPSKLGLLSGYSIKTSLKIRVKNVLLLFHGFFQFIETVSIVHQLGPKFGSV